MERELPEVVDWSYNDALEVAEAREQTNMAISEIENIIHVSEFGRQPEIGIPIFDAFIDVGCPCRQCFRDEFLS